MCTLTYIPIDGGFIFTHNRDERKDRPTSSTFQKKEVTGKTIYYPEDLEAHGSWIGFGSDGTAACLMNGGSKSYIQKAKYRKSRGLVVLEGLEYPSIHEFCEQYNFVDIEPFTLLLKNSSEFIKITHNEDETLFEEQDAALKNIWSSTTLYTEEVRNKRRKWFEEWLAQKPALNPENIQAFHNSGGDGDSENDLVMSRWGILKTLSISQIMVQNKKAELLYRDFVGNTLDRKSLIISQ